MSWRSMNELALPDPEGPQQSFMVWNGERVGEAVVGKDWGSWDNESDDPPIHWAWTHHSTCACCHSFMKPQPIAWQPMPTPPAVRHLLRSKP